MARVVVGFIAAAFVFAGWRNLPRLDQPSAGAAGLLLAGAVVVAFFLGRRSVHAEAVATAVASARAEAAAAAHAGAQAVSQVVVNVGDGARAVAAREYGQPAWIGPARFESEQLEGSDAVSSMLDEILEQQVDQQHQ
jgi:hypothetical protein